MAGPRRVAPAPPAPPAASAGINFGELETYVGGFTLPEGDYALEFDVRMHAGTKADGTPAGQPRLGVMISAYPLTGGEPHTQFMSMGSKAHESFAPDPNTGKSLVAIPGGAGANPNNKTNWYLFLKSLYDCGLPQGIFTNDLSTIDGVWVHTQNIPEPEERKGFGAKTGEQDLERRNNLVPVVTEIKEDGKPWEGTGGFEGLGVAEAPAAAPAKAAVPARPGLKPVAPKPAVAAKAAPVAVAAPAGEEDTLTAAINGISAVLEKNPTGVTKLIMRTGTFKAVNEALGPEAANAVITQFFGSDEALNSVLGTVGYVIVGAEIKPQTA